MDFYHEKQNYCFINFKLCLVHGTVVILYFLLYVFEVADSQKLGAQGLSRFLSLSLESGKMSHNSVHFISETLNILLYL